MISPITLERNFKTSYGYICIWTAKIGVNSSPNDKILDVSKLKAFADDKMNVARIMIPVFDRVENIVVKGENAGYQHFLLFPQCFQKVPFTVLLKVGIVW